MKNLSARLIFGPPAARPTGRWALLLALLALLLGGGPARAGAGPGAPALATVLNPDGTVRAGARGSFDATGYALATAPGGRPAFRPAAARALRSVLGPLGAGDSNWSDAFALNGSNGGVYVVAVSGANVYVGGQFTTTAATPTNNIARWNGSAWSALGAGVNLQVNAIAVDGSGNVFAGGTFTQAGGAPANRVAKWDGSAWTALGAGVNNSVNALAVDGSGNLFVGGFFTQAGGNPASRAARWDGSAWTALGAGLNNGVSALAVSGSSVYAGGFFTTADGNPASYVARWNGTAWSALGAGVGSFVSALAVDGGGNVFAGGQFTTAGGNPASYVARWNGSAWSALGAGIAAGGYVRTLALDGSGNLVAGGGFAQAGAVPASNVARWNGTAWSALGAGLPDVVNGVAVGAGGAVYAVGSFPTAVFGGTAWAVLGPLAVAEGLNGSVKVLAADGSGNLYAGGSFTQAGSLATVNIARWNGSAWSTLAGGTNVGGDVTALAADAGGNLYAGGFFSLAGGVPANRVARWNGTAWTALGAGMNAAVSALAVSGTAVFAGGQFTTAGSVAANYVARWNGSAWSALGAGTDANVFALAVTSTGLLYAGGSFATAGGAAASRIAQWNGTAWAPVGTGITGTNVRALVLNSAGVLYAGGVFTQAGSVAAVNIAQWNGTAWAAVGTGMAPADFLTALAVDGAGGLYAGGSFASIGGTTVNNVAKWDGMAWTSLGTGTDATVLALATVGSSTYAGGDFFRVGDGSKVMAHLGRYTVALAPVLAGISPGSGPAGQAVVLSGTGFAGTTQVTFIGGSTSTVLATAFTSFNYTAATNTINLNVPAGLAAGTYTVTVTTPAGTSNAVSFVVIGDLIVSTGTAASPVSVPAGTYNNFTVTGTGVAQLAGAVVVNTAVVVQDGGLLLTNCQLLTGSGSFTLAAGATLGICDANGITASGATGAVQVAGTRTFSVDASYLYNGTAAQVTGAGLPAQVRALSTTNANNVTLSQALRVARELTVGAAGNVVLNGQGLTLLSDATGTALVMNSGAGLVTGATASMQRALASATGYTGPGYHHYSAPVSGNTLADLTTGSFTPVFNNAYNAAAQPGLVAPFPTVFGYEQSRLATVSSPFSPFDKGWYSPSNAANQPDAMTLGRGYTVNIAVAEVVDFTGTLNSGAYTLPLARNATGTPGATDAGWQLVGNPYPAPLDWNAVTAADRPGLDASMYVFEASSQYGGTYRTNVNGMGATALIGSSQGFFVRVSGGQTSGSLTFRNAQRLTSYATQVSVRRGTADARPQVRLALTSPTAGADDLIVYAEAGATPGVDAAYDARKLPNPSGLNLTALATTGEALAISGLPLLTAATVVPLTLHVPAAGTYALTAPLLANLPASTQVFLTDALTGQRLDLRTLPATGHAFTLTAAQAAAPVAGRFFLNLVPAASPLAATAGLSAATVSVYPNPAHDRLTVLVPGVKGALQVEAGLYNTLGQRVLRQVAALPATGATLPLDVRPLAAGVYVLRLQAGAALLTRQVVIE